MLCEHEHTNSAYPSPEVTATDTKYANAILWVCRKGLLAQAGQQPQPAGCNITKLPNALLPAGRHGAPPRMIVLWPPT